MLNANKIAPGVKKIVYKVGDEHIADMTLLGISPAGGMEVLTRTAYLKDYSNLKKFNADHEASGNGTIFGKIGNEKL
jgi:hypothetical protein